MIINLPTKHIKVISHANNCECFAYKDCVGSKNQPAYVRKEITSLSPLVYLYYVYLSDEVLVWLPVWSKVQIVCIWSI